MMIDISIEDHEGNLQVLDVPVDMGLNLMEILKAYEYDIPATCGGMGLCATCHIQVMEGLENLPEMNENELATLDTLPDADFDSRLACQIRPDLRMNGLVLRLKHTEFD